MSEQQILEIDNELDLTDQFIETVDGIESEESDKLSDNPFNPDDIHIDTKPFTLDLIIKRIQRSILNPNEKSRDGINLSPDFQRRAGLWDREKQSRLIESIFLRIPLPVFYVAEDVLVDNHWIIVDGLQRMTTLKNFIVDKNLRLTKLEYNAHLDGKNWDEIPDYLRTRLEETQVFVHIIKRRTPEAVLFNVFKRINTGGIALSLQEIRHALNQGRVTTFLRDLAEHNDFKRATGYGVKPDRMADRECVLRFIAFMHTPYEEYREINTLNQFLSNVMKDMNKANDSTYNQLFDKFILAMQRAYELFDGEGFRKIGKRKFPVNKALFEVWSVLLGNLSEKEAKRLIKDKEVLRKEFEELLQNQQFVNSISAGTGSTANVQYRFSEVQKLIERVLNGVK